MTTPTLIARPVTRRACLARPCTPRSSWRSITWMLAIIAALASAGAAQAAGPQHAPSAGKKKDVPVASDWKPRPMVTGYFDHTADWYRRNKRPFEQSVAQGWASREVSATVVLYNDIRATGAKGAKPGMAADIRARIAERRDDIAGYLDAAGKRNVRVLLQLPDEIVERWAGERREMEPLLTEFIEAWRERPALRGFYVYDEAELHDIPVATLQEIAGAIRKHARAGSNTAAFSVAYSAVRDRKPLFLAYAAARPTAFDTLLVNRYPVYRAYADGAGDVNFTAGKLGLPEQKARRENLRDNEFGNLADYYDSLVAATQIPGIDGRPIYASMQAYGLRDDCDGPSCVPVKERKPRRSPTWGELLNMYSSVWMSGLDGAVLYARYFSLYDAALQKRLANLERLTPGVFRNLPGRGAAIAVRAGGSGASQSDRSPPDVYARYVPEPSGGKSYYLVVLQTGKGRKNIRVPMSPQLRITDVRELRFDSQGNPLEPVATPFRKTREGIADEMSLELPGFAVRIFELRYD